MTNSPLALEKECTKCGSILPLSVEFFCQRKEVKDGFSSWCRECINEHNRFKHKDNPEKKRTRTLRNKFKLTMEDYEIMLAEQDYVCAICKQPAKVVRKGKIMRLAVDHDHDTNFIRGLLCHQCNIGLGNFQDSVAYLSSAVDYLEGHTQKNIRKTKKKKK